MAEGEDTAKISKKGTLFEKGKIDEAFGSLKNITEKTLSDLSLHASHEVAKSKYSLWMDKYEHYMECHQNLMARLKDSDKENYVSNFVDRDAYLQNFKKTIENYLMASKQKIVSVYSDVSKQRSHSSRHTGSSMLSKISSKRLMEEQRKAELEAQRDGLKKKREIEMAKIQLNMDEEELKISTDIAVANAKSKVLDKYEKLEHDNYDTGTFTTASSHSTNKIRNETFVVQLNPKAKTFEPETTNSYRNKQSVDDSLLLTRQLSTDNETTKYVNPYNNSGKKLDILDHHTLMKHLSDHDHTYADQELDSKPQDNNNNSTSDAVTAVVKNLRKPNPEIKRFGGDPFENLCVSLQRKL